MTSRTWYEDPNGKMNPLQPRCPRNSPHLVGCLQEFLAMIFRAAIGTVPGSAEKILDTVRSCIYVHMFQLSKRDSNNMPQIIHVIEACTVHGITVEGGFTGDIAFSGPFLIIACQQQKEGNGLCDVDVINLPVSVVRRTRSACKTLRSLSAQINHNSTSQL